MLSLPPIAMPTSKMFLANMSYAASIAVSIGKAVEGGGGGKSAVVI
jgi:hypothetical protein